MAVWAYLMAQFTDPGHINYSAQKHLKTEDLNDRLFDWIMFNAQQSGGSNIQMSETRRSMGSARDDEDDEET